MDALRGICDEFIAALAPVVNAAADPEELQGLLAELGWTPSAVPQPLRDALASGAPLLDVVGSGLETIGSAEVFELISQLVQAVNAIATAPDGAFPAGIDVTTFKATIARDLFDYALAAHLLHHRTRLGAVLKLAGLLRVIDTPAAGARQRYLRYEVAWNRVGALLTDPARGFREAFDWESATPALSSAIFDVGALLESFGLRLSFFEPGAGLLTFINAGATVPLADPLGVDLSLDDALGVPPGSEAGVQLLVRPQTAQRGPAVAVLPYARLSGSTAPADDDGPSLAIRGDADLTQGFAVTLAPGREPVVDAGFLGGQTTATARANMQVALRVPPAPGEPERIIVGTLDASRLSLRTVTFSAGTAPVSAQQLDAFVELGLDELRLVVKPAADEADSFISSLLGKDGISAELSLGLRLSSLTGFHFTGSSGLEASLPVGVRLGPADVQAISIGLKSSAQGVDLEAGATVHGDIGPVAMVVDRVGFKLNTRFPDPPNGNLGLLDVAFGFLPPGGIGLSVDAQGVLTGGGFLASDPERGEYAGGVHLQFEGIAVRATGLLTTHLPGGRPGYSLLVLVSAEFPPLQLGLGFMLVGVGGLLGIHRTVAVEALRAGLKTGALGAVLSPPDPKASPGQLVATLAGLFPPAAGRHLFAPTARIVWGSPTQITIELCLVLELPSPVRLVALGRLRAVLPDEREAIVRLQVDVLGVVDFDRREAAVDATLVDSRLAQFALTGDMALRLSWGARPSFLLAVGGFHPRFAAPPGFPALVRVAVALAGGDNPKLRLEAYLALTSNTVQFGARVDLAARAGSFSIAGFLSFDALVTLAPLGFVVDIAAKLAVKAGGRTILSVSLALTLSGPRPWRARGRASFSILFFDVSFGFDVTIGDDAPPALPAPVDVAPLLLAALADPRAWSAPLPAGGAALVTLRELEPGTAGTAVLAHPHATLQVRQRVAPLERTLERFGTSVPSGARRFRITLATIGGVRTTLTGLQDRFAPAQFTALSDDAKLSAPSFEEMTSGAALGAGGYATGAAVTVSVVYEQLLVTAPGVAEPSSQRVAIPGDVFATLTATPPARPPAFAVREAA